ncbi:hypothetical protein [Streptomyces showdoensis]|uniref:Uncharacterized protein n=1 Tax=Streptomyces showdoensis TaxID=68268 RepID=A0A2P2GVS6_STREW|nr:hypothetical protein [Streptomyces showdoensis]KKZ75586.1 hypothetical protein VO63_01820 [Streptomyces showdoensis]
MRRAETNGIPLYWDDIPGPFTAHLLLGTGIEYEPLPVRGVTEVAEQLALGAVADAARGCDELASAVGGDHLCFTVAGEPERVAEVLNRLCRALAEPPVDGLAGAVRRAVARQLREERWEGFQERELAFRYGLRGPGKTGRPAPAVEGLGAAEVRAWAAARFTRGGAALLLTGPPPKSLDPRLPEGPAAERPVAEPLPGTSGCWLEAPHEAGEQVTLSFDVPSTPVGHLAADVARVRAAHDPDIASNLTGEVELHSSYLGGGRMRFWLLAPTDELGTQAVADGLDAVLRGLAAQGPAEEEVRRAVAVRSTRLDTDAGRHAQLFGAGLDHVSGLEVLDVPAARARLAAAGAEDVRAALAGYPSTAVLVLPAHCAPGPDSPFVPEPDRFDQDFHEARTYRPRLFGPVGRHERMYLGDEGLAHWTGHCHHSVRWHQVAGLGVFPSGRRVLYGELGAVIDIQADWYKSGGDLIAAVDSRVPPSLRFPRGDGEPI